MSQTGGGLEGGCNEDEELGRVREKRQSRLRMDASTVAVRRVVVDRPRAELGKRLACGGGLLAQSKIVGEG